VRQQANKKPETSRHKKNLKDLILYLHNKRKLRRMQALVADAHPKTARAFLRAYTAWLRLKRR
jgi:hypothetical protein